jgi:hypothetical protein
LFSYWITSARLNKSFPEVRKRKNKKGKEKISTPFNYRDAGRAHVTATYARRLRIGKILNIG